MTMVDTQRATVTMPGVAPDMSPGWPDAGPGGAHNGDAEASSSPSGAPKSALAGLRGLAGPKFRGAGGGGPRSPRRPGGGGGGGGIDLRNTWQILLGSIMVPVGIVFILISWYGAAHTPYVQQQIPYLVSGSFVGLGFLILGGLLYWAHWLYRIYDQADLHHEEQLRVFEQTLKMMAERTAPPASQPMAPPPGQSPAAPGGYSPPPPPPASSEAPSYVVTPSGSVYHAPSCPVIVHHTEGLRVLGPGAVADMDPCRICLPATR
ncbi:MAG: hypothetical protein ACYDD6_02015 [Acidimicrobiales bacterium]